MNNAWCRQHDAYLVHGNATAVLGTAAKTVYKFIRRSLNVLLLSTMNLSTPTGEELRHGSGVHGSRAPCVGSCTGVVY